ncbi:MAG: adenine phosphoribosyltransferase [Ignavibacteria bacterium]|nr:adenine phosphoribosyltransferase [Bacteroidota bacterium]MSQ45449.1 adenine phosphoribosyltransferase [Ignavibacteria bacterium]
MDLEKIIRTVPDFPKKGIYFKDLTPIWEDNNAVKYIVKKFVEFSSTKNITHVVGIESRGFILGSLLANELGIGFVPIRKKGKLPGKTFSQEYKLEYGKDSMEIHIDALKKGDQVILHDDVLATGGTLEAALKLINQTGATVAGICLVVELAFLNGGKKVENYELLSLVKYFQEN